MTFCKRFPSCTAIIDCFEIFLGRHTNLLGPRHNYSSYKHHNAVIGIQGTVIILVTYQRVGEVWPLTSTLLNTVDCLRIWYLVIINTLLADSLRYQGLSVVSSWNLSSYQSFIDVSY